MRTRIGEINEWDSEKLIISKHRLYIYNEAGKWIGAIQSWEKQMREIGLEWEGSVKDFNPKKEEEYHNWLKTSQKHTYDVLGDGVALIEVRGWFDKLGLMVESELIGLKEFFDRMDTLNKGLFVKPSKYSCFERDRDGYTSIEKCWVCDYFEGQTIYGIRCSSCKKTLKIKRWKKQSK